MNHFLILSDCSGCQSCSMDIHRRAGSKCTLITAFVQCILFSKFGCSTKTAHEKIKKKHSERK